MLHEYFESLKTDISALKGGAKSIRAISERFMANRGTQKSWIEALMTPDQLEIFYRIQALMCIIEGYSNHVMNVVGKDLMPDYEKIARRFAQRQSKKGRGDQIFARLTGLDVKLEQYRLGEEFIDAIVAKRGREVGLVLWSGPEAMPTMEELKAPDRWLARVRP